MCVVGKRGGECDLQMCVCVCVVGKRGGECDLQVCVCGRGERRGVCQFSTLKTYVCVLVIQDQSMAFGSDRSRFVDNQISGKR